MVFRENIDVTLVRLLRLLPVGNCKEHTGPNIALEIENQLFRLNQNSNREALNWCDFYFEWEYCSHWSPENVGI